MNNKKIKIVGQPMFNIGDLAACKSLSLLLQNKLDSPIEYLIFKNQILDGEFEKIKGVKFVNNITIFNKYLKFISIICPHFIKVISFFFPKIKKRFSSLLDSDFIIFAPGGLELGLYKNWDYLWIMSILVAFKKDFGIYSRSIGDFQSNTILDLIFKKRVIHFLNLSKFNDLRDQKSQKEAEELGIHYNKSIDVVFSNTPNYELTNNDQLLNKLENNYIVFVPSAFEWHPKFSTYSPKMFFDLYLQIMEIILKNTDMKIIMLPHNYKNNSDVHYFNSLRSKCNEPERVFVLENKYDSDLYQYIIGKAKFAILSRLHQTIFSINNHTPFLCISYEHKMQDMMKIIGLEDYTIKLIEVIEKSVDIKEIILQSLKYKTDKTRLVKAQQKANEIALESFRKLSEVLSI